MRIEKIVGILLLLFVSVAAGCSSVTSETVELSATTSGRLSTLKDVHIEITNQYFDEKIKNANDFVDNEWKPLFLRNMLGQSSVLDDLENASSLSGKLRSQIEDASKLYLSDPSESKRFVSALSSKLTPLRRSERDDIDKVINNYIPDDKKATATSHIMSLLGSDEAGQIMIEFAADANKQISLFRESLIKPLETSRRKELELINQSYGDIIQAQSIITARLEAEMKKDNATNALFDGILGKDRAEELRETTRELTHQSYKTLQELPLYDESTGFDEWTKAIQKFFQQHTIDENIGN